MSWINTILTIILTVLGVSLLRTRVMERFPHVTDKGLDLTILTVFILSLGVTFLLDHQNEQSQRATEEQLAALKEKDSLRKWAMVLPTGELTFDGLNPMFASVGYTELHQKVFRRKGSQVSAGSLQDCASTEYMDNIRKLIDAYPQLAYGDFALALCLKAQGHPEWQTAAKQAQAKLRKLISVQPRTTSIDGCYVFVSSWLGFTPEQLGFTWKEEKDGRPYLQPLDLP